VVPMHGPKGRNVVMEAADNREAAFSAIEQLTCSRQYVEQSIGTIVHSKFARHLLENDALLKVAPAIHVVPPPRALLPFSDNTSRRGARRQLSLDVDGLIIASFGHIASTKTILELIEAFCASEVG